MPTTTQSSTMVNPHRRRLDSVNNRDWQFEDTFMFPGRSLQPNAKGSCMKSFGVYRPIKADFDELGSCAIF